MLFLYIQGNKKYYIREKKEKKLKKKGKEKLLYDFVCHLESIKKGIADHWLLAPNAESILHI